MAPALALVLATGLAACGRFGIDIGTEPEPGGLQLSFEDEAAPDVFLIEAPAVRDSEDGAEGLWAAVRGLKRPERAEAVNIGTGASISLALYAAGAGAPAIRLSNAAAEAIGVEREPVTVRITALRRHPVVEER